MAFELNQEGRERGSQQDMAKGTLAEGRKSKGPERKWLVCLWNARRPVWLGCSKPEESVRARMSGALWVGFGFYSEEPGMGPGSLHLFNSQNNTQRHSLL